MEYEIIPLGNSRRDRFTYRSETALQAGQVVRIPFGKGSRIGIVAATGSTVPGLKPISEVTPLQIPQRTVELIEWTARSYLAPSGVVAKLALPEYLIAESPQSPVALAPSGQPGDSTRHVLVKRRRLSEYRAQLESGSFLVLVPEIALAESLGSLERETGATRFHSKLTTAERRRIWRGVADGTIAKVIGTRAALWLPWPSLQTVIVDEEDDRSYKSERTPRYHTRTVATKLALLHGAKLILASAAPSLETWQHGSDQDWKIDVEQEAFPTVVRTRAGSPREPLDSISLGAVQTAGRHVVWAPERLQRAVLNQLQNLENPPSLTVFRQDYGSRAMVAAFTSHSPGIIIGSSALTHPWELQTTTVVVLGLDALLQLADFRSAERAHGILRKLAAHASGQLIIQTDHPDHPAIELLERDPGAFYTQEAAERVMLKLPPSTRLTRLTAASRTPAPETAAYLQSLDALSVRKIHPRTWLVSGDPRQIPRPIPPGWQADVDTLNPL